MPWIGFKSLLILTGALIVSQSASAMKIKVEKIKGNKAIVVFKGELEPGKVYEMSLKTRDVASSAGFATSRQRVLGFSFLSSGMIGGDMAQISMLSTSPGGTSSTSIGVGGKFGWNKGPQEYGLLAGLSLTNGAGTSSTSYLVGGFFDYNFTPNLVGVENLSGVSLEAAVGSVKIGSVSSSSMALFPHFFYKWFILGPNSALRFEGGYYYASISSSPAVKTSGPLGRLSFAHYF